VDVEKLKQRLESVGEAVERDQTGAWRQVLGSRLITRGKVLAAAIDQAGHLYSPEQLHQVRIASKKLRYALELAADSGVPSAAPCVRALKRTQETLGRLHDLQVLQGHVAAVQAEPLGRAVPHEGLGAIAGRIEEECRRLHGKYVAHVEPLRAIADAIRTDIVPRLTRPRGRAVKMQLVKPRRAAGSTR
jgi:CHAD domain-containing protein